MVSDGKTATVAAIGNFDGVHVGHQRLMAETVALAQRLGAQPGAVMFDPHPRRFFRPDEPPFLLTTLARREALLREHGAKVVSVIAFDARLSAMSPEAFVGDILKKELGLAGVVAGKEFRFGAKRAGDGAALAEIGAACGIEVMLCDVLADGPDAEKIGSRAVRAALRDGDVAGATRMLGRPWVVTGAVVEGQKIGRTIGFPTANMMLGELMEPRRGSYVVRARVDGATYDSVANFGRRPTVGASSPLLEVHLLGFEGDLYGKEIEVEFVAFIRDEMKFDGLDALKAQIAKDRDLARRTLAED